MATSNPFLNRAKTLIREASSDTDTGVMTLAGAATKTLILAALAIGSAAYTWRYVAAVPEQAGFLTMVSVIGAFIVALVTIFSPRRAPYSAPLYAVLEGTGLGAMSALLNGIPKYRGLPVQAVMLTFAVFLGMALLYRFRIIRATERFKAILSAAMFGVFAYYVLNMLLSLAGAQMPFINSASPIGIGFSVVVCAIAAFNLIMDFGMMEDMAASGAPKFMEWYTAFGLIVTLVWLYMELLRLLMKLRDRD